MTTLRATITAFLAVLQTMATQWRNQPPIFDLGKYEGQVVVLDFWASWCVPCRRSFPWLNAMHAKYAGQGLVIIGVNLDARTLTMLPHSWRTIPRNSRFTMTEAQSRQAIRHPGDAKLGRHRPRR